MSSHIAAQAQVLIGKLLRSGDEGRLLLGPEAEPVVAWLVDRGFVEVAEGQERFFSVQLKRMDRAGMTGLH